MKDHAGAPDCLMCEAIPFGLTCTLHGGHMTATEVELRRTHKVSEDQWVKRHEPLEGSWILEPLIDKAHEIIKKRAHE